MKDLDAFQIDHETKSFEALKADLRYERDQALRYWKSIKKRYVYRGRQYRAQEVIDWFMAAPYMEVKAISEELRIDWKTIGNDIRRIADPLSGLEEKRTILLGPKASFVEDAGVYATPRIVKDIEQCYFYHTIDLPGYGTIHGDWDLRDGIKDYLGGVNFRGKRILDVGTANGMICFNTEKQGGKVTAFDLSKDYSWNLVPYTKWKEYEYATDWHHSHIDSLNNAYWFCHRSLNSNAKVVYGDVYNIPEQIGQVDIAIYGSILLHLRDPFLALQSGTRLAREGVVVTDVLRDETHKLKEPYLRFLPDPETSEPKDTWWDLSPEFVVRVVKVLGFENTSITYHSQTFKGDKIRLFTVVGRRTS